MKNRLQTLETLHDYILEDIYRNQIDIRSVEDLKDEEELPNYGKPGKYGMTPITKKDFTEDRRKRIDKLEKDLHVVEVMMAEQAPTP